MKAIIIVHSYHHGSTRKIADVISESLCAEVKTTMEISPIDAAGYDIIGLGAGIDSGHHYKPLLDFAEALPKASGQKAFIFSTAGVAGIEKKKLSDHKALRGILQSKSYEVLDEFTCRGYNTNKFLKYFGGMNKGRPNADDFHAATIFANSLKGRVRQWPTK
jgi:flavodoxin